MTLRPAAPADAPRLAAIARAAYGGYVERIGVTPGPLGEDYARIGYVEFARRRRGGEPVVHMRKPLA